MKALKADSELCERGREHGSICILLTIFTDPHHSHHWLGPGVGLDAGDGVYLDQLTRNLLEIPAELTRVPCLGLILISLFDPT